MAAPGTPNNMAVQTQNGKILISWNLTSGATSYDVQRSLDNVTFTDLVTVSGSPLATEYLDTAVTNGTAYWYRVRATNGDGSSSYTTSQFAVPTESGEMSLGAIRLASQQTADRVNSNFVTMPEWNSFINLAMYELYDLLVTLYEDYYVATPIQFTTNGNDSVYPLPNGVLTFTNGFDLNATITAKPFYKLLGVDAQIQNANNGYVTINKYNFIDRNSFVYPNTASTIYGVFNMQYRVMGNNLQFIPTPSANQGIRVWYIPRLTALLQDTDVSDISISGWIRYVIVRAAIYALAKEESDTTLLEKELAFLRTRIEESGANRDAGQPDRISDTRSVKGYWGSGVGWPGSGSTGGFAFGAIPIFATNDIADHAFRHFINFSQVSLAYIFGSVAMAYLIYLLSSKFYSPIKFSGPRFNFSWSLSTFFNHILSVVLRSAQKQMRRINAFRVITSVANEYGIRFIELGQKLYKLTVGEPRSANPITADFKSSVPPISITASCPNPTFFRKYRFIGFFKEALNSAFSSSHSGIIASIARRSK